jgi:cytochrome P450
MERLEASISHEANDIVSELINAESVDFVKSAAGELPIRVLTDLLGVPRADRHLLFEWTDAIAMTDVEYSPNPDATTAALGEMYLYGHELAAERRRSPQDDLVSRAVNAEIDGERLSEFDFDMLWILLIFAGNETTRNLLSGGLLALLDHEQEQARLWADRGLMKTAVEEMLRWVTPVNCFRRTAAKDAAVGGHHIAEGDKVVLYYTAVNRDPRAFADPHRFDVSRIPNDHVAFGIGPHFCLGANLARLEAQKFYDALIVASVDVQLTGTVEYTPSAFINGIARMPVKVCPTRGGGNGRAQ